jgi:hypothetical protein
MVNNSSNTHKTNNNLSTQTIEHKKDSLHIAFEIQVTMEWSTDWIASWNS